MPYTFDIESKLSSGLWQPALHKILDSALPIGRLETTGHATDDGIFSSGTCTIYHSDGDEIDFTAGQISMIESLLSVSVPPAQRFPVSRAYLRFVHLSPNIGDTVYVADLLGAGSPGYAFWNGSAWKQLHSPTTTVTGT